MRHFAPLVAASMCLAYCIFELIIVKLLVRYLPDHKVTKKLLRLTRRMDKLTKIGQGVLPFVNESDSEQPEDSSSMYESERETDKESDLGEVVSPTTNF